MILIHKLSVILTTTDKNILIYRQTKSIVFVCLFVLKSAQLFPQSDTSLIRLGRNLYEKGDYKKAIKAYEQATSLNPKSGQAFRLLGETYFRIVKLDQAINALEKAILLDSTDNKALLDLGIAKSHYYFKDKNKIFLDQSDDVYNKIIHKDYEVPYTYMLIAYNFAYRQDFSNCWKFIY